MVPGVGGRVRGGVCGGCSRMCRHALPSTSILKSGGLQLVARAPRALLAYSGPLLAYAGPPLAYIAPAARIYWPTTHHTCWPAACIHWPVAATYAGPSLPYMPTVRICWPGAHINSLPAQLCWPTACTQWPTARMHWPAARIYAALRLTLLADLLACTSPLLTHAGQPLQYTGLVAPQWPAACMF